MSRAVVVAIAVLVLAGCGDKPSRPDPAPAATATVPDDVPAEAEAARAPACPADDDQVAVLGDETVQVGPRFGSDVGIVAVSGPGGDACQWFALAQAIARRGPGTLVSATGEGDDPAEVRANVRRMRRNGSRRVVLLSTSAGGPSAIAAALDGPPVDALVTLSAVRYADGSDAARKARRLGIPQLHIGSRGDALTSAGDDTRAFGRAGPAVLVSGAAHGTDMITEHRELVPRIVAFVKRG